MSDRWNILEIGKDLKTKIFLHSLSSSYAIALERFQLLQNGFENLFQVLDFYCRRNVQQVFSQLFH